MQPSQQKLLQSQSLCCIHIHGHLAQLINVMVMRSSSIQGFTLCCGWSLYFRSLMRLEEKKKKNIDELVQISHLNIKLCQRINNCTENEPTFRVLFISIKTNVTEILNFLNHQYCPHHNKTIFDILHPHFVVSLINKYTFKNSCNYNICIILTSVFSLVVTFCFF